VFEVFVSGQRGGIEQGLDPVLGLAQFPLIERGDDAITHPGVLRDEINQLPVVDRPPGDLAQRLGNVVTARTVGARDGHIHPVPDIRLFPGLRVELGCFQRRDPAHHQLFPMDGIDMFMQHGSLPCFGVSP